MKIVEQSYEIISNVGMLKKDIEFAGRTCYKSEDKITDESAEKFVSKLIKNGHDAMLEFGDITVKFITNRGVTHELVRHRLFSFAQESTRYVRYGKDMEFIRPVWFKESNLTQQTSWLQAMLTAEERYIEHRIDGWRPELARDVLPNALKTEIVVKGNVREWRHMLSLRCSKHAHPQMRELMTQLLSHLKKIEPVLFGDICSA